MTRQLADSSRAATVAKELAADILPPPMSLIETRHVLSQAREGSMDPNVARWLAAQVRACTADIPG